MTPDVSRLPRVTPAVAAVMNRLAAKCWLFTLPDDPERAEDRTRPPILELAFGDTQPLHGFELEIRVAGQFGQVVLATNTALVDTLSDVLLPDWREEDQARLPVEWRATLVLTLCASGASIEQNIAELTASPSPCKPPYLTRGTSLTAAAYMNGAAFPLGLTFLSATPEAAEMVLRGFHKGPLEMLDPGFACRLGLPPRAIAFRTYTELTIGDLVLIAQVREGALPVIGRIPRVARFSANIHADGLLSVDDIFPPEARELAMSNEPAVQPDHADEMAILGTPSDAVDALPVTLDCVLKSRRLTLAELRELGPGLTLDLRVDLTAPVTIMANGAALGVGYLVQIDDHIGVQIAQWPTSKAQRGA